MIGGSIAKAGVASALFVFWRFSVGNGQMMRGVEPPSMPAPRLRVVAVVAPRSTREIFWEGSTEERRKLACQLDYHAIRAWCLKFDGLKTLRWLDFPFNENAFLYCIILRIS